MTLVIKDIKVACPSCQGSGEKSGFNEYGTLLSNPGGRCLQCQGRGYVLTELGQELLEALRPFIEEMIHQPPAPPSKIDLIKANSSKETSGSTQKKTLLRNAQTLTMSARPDPEKKESNDSRE